MFNFVNDFLSDNKIPQLSNKSFKCFNIDGKFLYVENFKKIINICENEILIKLYSGELSIIGENLSVKEIGVSCISIVGKIVKIEQVA